MRFYVELEVNGGMISFYNDLLKGQVKSLGDTLLRDDVSCNVNNPFLQSLFLRI